MPSSAAGREGEVAAGSREQRPRASPAASLCGAGGRAGQPQLTRVIFTFTGIYKRFYSRGERSAPARERLPAAGEEVVLRVACT